MQINIGGELLDVGWPVVMGILNVTPDSFYAHSRSDSIDHLVRKAKEMYAQGASILDIGGYSTRPGAAQVSIEEEHRRVIPVIKVLRNSLPKAILSIDTFRSEIAYAALEAGASIINDVSGGSIDKKIWQVAADKKAPYVLTHSCMTDQNLHNPVGYNNVVLDVHAYFQNKLEELQKVGVTDVILDPGFGFSKNLDQNMELLKLFSYFKSLNRPLLVGISRKSMIYKTLQSTPEQALAATTALHAVLVRSGASILRVHDVQEAVDTIRILGAMESRNTLKN